MLALMGGSLMFFGEYPGGQLNRQNQKVHRRNTDVRHI
jgi:hypothetical protein